MKKQTRNWFESWPKLLVAGAVFGTVAGLGAIVIGPCYLPEHKELIRYKTERNDSDTPIREEKLLVDEDKTKIDNDNKQKSNREYAVSYTKYASAEPYAIDKEMKTIRGIVSESELENLIYMNTHNYIGDLKYEEFKRRTEEK